MELSDFVVTLSDLASAGLEVLGIIIIALNTLIAIGNTLLRVGRRQAAAEIFRFFRRSLGMGILIGLEFMVAADIVRTVVVLSTFRNATSFRSLGVLAAIIAVRTFLSFAMELEMTGHWPWQGGPEHRDDTGYGSSPD
jgi:uncharacterized membrane protein